MSVGVSIVNIAEVALLSATIKGLKTSLPRELSIIVNYAAKKSKTNIAKQIGDVVTIKKADIKRDHIKVIRATRGIKVTASVELIKTGRPSLRQFKPTHKKKGVSYRISKLGGRETVPGAFMGPKPGMLAPKLYGGVYIRKDYTPRKTKRPKAGLWQGPKQQVVASKGRHKGKLREPIIKLHGVSPWAVFTKNHMIGPEMADIRANVRAELNDRIRYNKLKQLGQLRGNQT